MRFYTFISGKGNVFFLVCSLATVISCKKFEPGDLPVSRESLTPEVMGAVTIKLSSSNLIHEEICEGLGPYFYPGSIQVGTSYGFTLASSPAFQGNKVARFELRDTDPSVSGGTRAEAKFPPITNTNRWYSFAVYFPSAYYKYDSKPEIINQWHQGGGESPSISLITRYGNLYVEIRANPGSYKQYNLGTIVKDKWQTFVLHINHLHSSSGLVDIWRDGSKIFSLTGANAYDYAIYEKPQWKLGLYKWEWNGTKTTDVNKRVIYFDNVRVGNENASYANMVVPATVNLNPPGSIKSFTLVNAATEKDIMTVQEGSVINLSQLGTSKLNMRANPGNPFGSVKFSLTGPQTRDHKDNYSPFTLMGDDNKYLYYYGSWCPPPTGSYTLTATPWSGLDGSGLLGYKKTIHFSFTK